MSTSEEALRELAEKTAAAVADVLSTLAGAAVLPGEISVLMDGAVPFPQLPFPLLASDVGFSGGVTGGNVFTISRIGARRLAAAMMMQEPPADDDRELDEIEMSAVSEAMNQMMAAGAAALSAALGYPVEISVPNTRSLGAAEEADGYPQTPYATIVSLSAVGETCHLIQLVPKAFVVRMTQALEGLGGEEEQDGDRRLPEALAHVLRDAPVRVAVELGRTRMRLDQLAAPPTGSVVELDTEADEPIDLCVNGQRFATGELVSTSGGEWAFRIGRLLDVNPADLVSPNEGGR